MVCVLNSDVFCFILVFFCQAFVVTSCLCCFPAIFMTHEFHLPLFWLFFCHMTVCFCFPLSCICLCSPCYPSLLFGSVLFFLSRVLLVLIKFSYYGSLFVWFSCHVPCYAFGSFFENHDNISTHLNSVVV